MSLQTCHQLEMAKVASAEGLVNAITGDHSCIQNKYCKDMVQILHTLPILHI